MSLFPAYTKNIVPEYVDGDSAMEVCEARRECELLASDEEPPAPAPAPAPASAPSTEWYVDRAADTGNLRVSTLYFPGRPQYRAPPRHASLGGGAGRRARSPRRVRRYYTAPPPPAPLLSEEVEGRARQLRAALAAAPCDEERALRYLAWCGAYLAPEHALEAARAAVAACSTRRTRDALAAARRRALPPSAVLDELRGELAAAQGAGRRAEVWVRLVEAGGAARAVRLTEAALDALPAACAPRLVHACGAALRAGGLSERLVQLVELTAAMNFPHSDVFPPTPDPDKEAAVERELADKEDKVIGSGLPVGTVWVRVERLRGAARWRGGAAGAADPQRRPAAGELGGALRAVAPREATALLAALLRLARVPPLPAAGWTARALPTPPDSGEWLAALLAAARRLPPAHPASPRAAPPAALRQHLAQLLDPPHYFTDATGYLSWVASLWEACCEWCEAEGAPLLAWRLRWLHMLAARADAAEARRLRGEARAAVRRHAAREPHHHALLARLEAAAEGRERGARAALRACRAAHAAPRPVALHAARLAAELCGATAARHALLAAVLRRPLPADELLDAPPAAADLAAAEDECVRRCAELERAWAEEEERGEEEEDPEAAAAVCAALLPADGEWAAARVALASPATRARLERDALAGRAWRRAAAARYAEQRAVALALAAAAEGRLTAVAAALLPRHPDSPLLALCAAGAPVWAPPVPWPPSDAACLARVAAALVRDAPPDALARVCARAARLGAGGAAVAAVALAAAAGGASGADRTALTAAADWPHHKWVCVRAAAAAPPLASSLADALLERELRVHALFEELVPATHS